MFFYNYISDALVRKFFLMIYAAKTIFINKTEIQVRNENIVLFLNITVYLK